MSPFLCLHDAFGALKGVPPEDRLDALLRAAGCPFHEPGLVAGPVVRCVGVGGLPVTRADPLELGGIPFSPEAVAAAFTQTQGLGAMLTYLNPRDRSPGELATVLARHGHGSTRHMCSVNIAIFGLTSAVEHEFATQRDLVHLARLTVARTSAQRRPPVVVLDPDHLPAYRAVRRATLERIQTLPRDTRDDDESLNALLPAAKASVLVLSGTLRNLDKLTEHARDDGKEREYRQILHLVRACLDEVEGPDGP